MSKIEIKHPEAKDFKLPCLMQNIQKGNIVFVTKSLISYDDMKYSVTILERKTGEIGSFLLANLEDYAPLPMGTSFTFEN